MKVGKISGTSDVYVMTDDVDAWLEHQRYRMMASLRVEFKEPGKITYTMDKPEPLPEHLKTKVVRVERTS